MKITIDGADELNNLADRFAEAAQRIADEAEKVVKKGALNVKSDARRRISGYAHLPRYPYSITYDTTRSGSVTEAEVGPDKAKSQGALGNLIEYGSLKNAPIPHLKPAADAEQPRFEKAMEDLGVRLIEGTDQ